MSRTNTDPKVSFTEQDPGVIDEIFFPGALFVERMSPNHYFAAIDGDSFDITRARKGAKWKLTRQGGGP
jgi:hypothetical protein